jgi:hypothetical protein
MPFFSKHSLALHEAVIGVAEKADPNSGVRDYYGADKSRSFVASQKLCTVPPEGHPQHIPVMAILKQLHQGLGDGEITASVQDPTRMDRCPVPEGYWWGDAAREILRGSGEVESVPVKLPDGSRGTASGQLVFEKTEFDGWLEGPAPQPIPEPAQTDAAPKAEARSRDEVSDEDVKSTLEEYAERYFNKHRKPIPQRDLANDVCRATGGRITVRRAIALHPRIREELRNPPRQ